MEPANEPIEGAENRVYRFETALWRWEGDGGWHFVTLPGEVSDDIRMRAAGSRRGFGSVRVRATIGATSWATSVFPDSRSDAYILPVKKQVRADEGLVEGDSVKVALELLDS